MANHTSKPANPLAHIRHHIMIAALGVVLLFLLYGSITIWEILLFFFASFLPIVDEFIFALLHYLEREQFRKVINLLLVGNYAECIALLHAIRHILDTLIVHNLFTYFLLWFLWYSFFIFDSSLGVYFTSGILVHLMFDLAIDQIEFGELARWVWPVSFLRAHGQMNTDTDANH